MAAHVRTQIRNAIASALTSLVTTGSRVFVSRVYPLAAADLPCLLVATRSETSSAVDISAPRTQERRLTITVSAVAKAVDDLDDTLDQVCQEVEVALAMPCAALESIGVHAIDLVSTEIGLDGSSDTPVGNAVMEFAIGYFVSENAPDVAQ